MPILRPILPSKMTNRLSLRTELLVSLAIISATALTLAVASVLVLYNVLSQDYAAVYISVLVGADVCILVAFVAYHVDRVVVRPLRSAMAAAEAIADGDLARRLDAGDTLEMHNLSTSVNLMTDRLLEERAHVVRAEKLASVGRLASGIAHEIGNPLGAINGYVHLLRTRSGNAAEEALAGLERESARIDRIVRGLLDYARPKHRSSANVDLNDVIHTVSELLSSQGLLKRIDLRLSPADQALVPGDRHELEQVLVNLLLNAIEAMNGVGTLEVILRQTTRAELLTGARRATDRADRPLNPPSLRNTRWLEQGNPGDSLIMVIVADSGPGVAPENADRIFEPFYTTKEPGKGTGLGLAIVARSVENAGGTIWVSRSREGGAAFRMLFPAAAAIRPRRSLRVEGSVVARAGVS
jgi:two-component system NtrC family sensor kinase